VPDAPVKNTQARDIAITPERLDAVIAALTTVADNALVESKARAVEKEFETWSSTFTKCVENAARSGSGMTSEGMEASGRYTAKMAPLLERMGKLATSSDKRAYEYVQDTLRVLGSESQLAMFGVTTCGKVRYAPSALLDAKAARAARTNTVVDESGVRWDINVPANKRAGMSHYQFGMVRERMALWSLIQAGAIPADKAGKDGVFTDAERSALTARNADIAKLAPMFRDGTMRWTNWGDITSW
jgi:hypothetical protein